MLKIKNIDKIVGVDLYSKWIPGTYGWAVRSVEGDGNTYYFELERNGRFRHAEIQLRREPNKYNPDNKVFLYELWAWNFQKGKAEKMWFSKQELDTIDNMVMRLGLMLEKIIPND
jgi:hypothetical protein